MFFFKPSNKDETWEEDWKDQDSWRAERGVDFRWK